MSGFLELISDEYNIQFAWEKVKNEATHSDIWFDEVELAEFELQLEDNLRSIKRSFLDCVYELKPIRPLPYPKQSDSEDNLRLRQIFQISIRDQVAWTAIVNVIGPAIDIKMPSWSYGNRLFRSIWIEEDADGSLRRRIGRYRHASGRIYLKYPQSWPIFKRHIYLTTRKMIQISDLPENDEQTENEGRIQANMLSNERTENAACQYLKDGYWSKHASIEKENDVLYWCSVDLEKFYPSIPSNYVLQRIIEHIPEEWRSEAQIVIRMMIKFPVLSSNWDNKDLKQIGLRSNQKYFYNIPTGLYVSGFLANVAMLDIDMKVQNILPDNAIAHFRYVDDHIILAYNFSDLLKWIRSYEKIVGEELPTVKINFEKVTPTELGKYLKRYDGEKKSIHGAEKKTKKVIEACKLDARYPSPLMTKTLALISGLTRLDLNLLESNELTAVADQLEHLLLVDVSENEIPEKTRISFAANKLINIAECRLSNPEDYSIMSWELSKLKVDKSLEEEIEHLEKQIGESKEEKNAQLVEELSIKRQEKTRKDKKVQSLEEQINKTNKTIINSASKAFQLIYKALRARPERIRLWARAIEMCRVTGVEGVSHIFKELKKIESKNKSYAEYLWAIILAKISKELLIAASVITDEDSAMWRKKRADLFIKNVFAQIISAELEKSINDVQYDFLKTSWQQVVFSTYCAKLMIDKLASESGGVNYPKRMIKNGSKINLTGTEKHDQIDWAWWVSRSTLRNLSPYCEDFVRTLASLIGTSKKANVFWRNFPLDIPTSNLLNLLNESGVELKGASGWYYEALNACGIHEVESKISNISKITNIVSLLNNSDADTITLYDWCARIEKYANESNVDPRCSEWTALEIIRKILVYVDENEKNFEDNIEELLTKDLSSEDIYTEIHPGNFRLPRRWVELNPIPNWREWQEEMEQDIVFVEKSRRIYDERYFPSADEYSNSLINRYRSFGLILFGLLRKSFRFPTIWNGSGNNKILRLFPSLLLSEVTCSSTTLGILQSCLSPRATENAYLRNAGDHNPMGIDDDTLRDPIFLKSTAQLTAIIEKSQRELKENQLSTLNFHARQLTPIDILQLTTPDWNRVFFQDTQSEE